jgi:hypothetical protein
MSTGTLLTMREVIFNRASKFDREPTADVRPSQDRLAAVMPAAAQRSAVR